MKNRFKKVHELLALLARLEPKNTIVGQNKMAHQNIKTFAAHTFPPLNSSQLKKIHTDPL